MSQLQKEHSSAYVRIRREAETKWPTWRVLTYNSDFATSVHAKKVVQQTEKKPKLYLEREAANEQP